MKKIISKILIILIILVMLFEFTCSSPICYAAGNKWDAESVVDRITSLMGGLVAFKFWYFRIQATSIVAVVWEVATMSLAESCGISKDTFFDWSSGKLMTPFDIFFNKYNILDVNFFDIEELNLWQTIWKNVTEDNIIRNLRLSVAGWYYTFRNLSSVILLVILIYVGIRMAISTVADEKAKYQKMLYDWVCSLILIFVLQYIIIFTIEANNAIVKFIRDSVVVKTEIGGFDFVAGTYTSMDGIIIKMALQATTGIGMGSFISIAALCMIFFQTMAFFFAYMNRVLKVAFLIVISPLISLTYSIDKIGDGKAQALNAWLKEFVYTILIQPFHAILYMAFVNTAMALLDATNPWIGAIMNILGPNAGSYNEIVNGVLVILCLKFVGDGEKIIRKIFNFQDDSSKTSLVAGAAVGLAGLNLMKKGSEIGIKAAGVVNKIGGLPIKFRKFLDATNHLDKVKEKFDKTSLGQTLNSKEFKDKMEEFKNKTKNSRMGKFVKRRLEGFKKFDGEYKFTKKSGESLSKLAKLTRDKKFQKYLPYTLGLMGAAMSYSTGSSGIMQAVGMGNAFKKGADGFFSASNLGISEDIKNQVIQETLANSKEYTDCVDQIGEKEHELGEIKRMRALQRKLDDIEEAKKSTDPSVVEKAEKEEEKLIHENRELYDRLGKVSDLEEREASLKKELKTLKNGKKEIEENVTKKIKNLSADDFRVLMQNMDTLKGKVSSAKKEMLRAIQAAMIEKKIRADGKDPTDPTVSHEKYQLTEDEQKQAQAIQRRMMTLMDRDVIGEGAEFNSTKNALDLFGSSNSGYEDVRKAFERYKSAKRGSEFCNGRDNHQKYGGEEENLRQLVIEQITGQHCNIYDCADQASDYEGDRLAEIYDELNKK